MAKRGDGRPVGLDRRRSCEPKKAYLSWHHASNDAKKVKKKARRMEVDVYHCRFCQHWHIGKLARDLA